MTETGSVVRFTRACLRPSMRSVLVTICLVAFLATSTASAAKLKNSEFLNFSEGQRHWWYSGAYTALGHVAFLQNEEKGECVWNWLAGDYEKREARLMESFRQYPDHTPTSIVIALLRRDCGVFLKDGTSAPTPQ